MKKLFFLILLFISVNSFGQRFPSVDSLQRYILRYVKNSAVESFTNLRMQNVVYGLTEYMGDGAVDSIWIVAGKDSIFYRRNGTTYKFRDSVGTGGGGGSYTAGNGLTLSGSEFKLGGTLSEYTFIDMGNNDYIYKIFNDNIKFELSDVDNTISIATYIPGDANGQTVIDPNGIYTTASGYGATSEIYVRRDSISFKPHLGRMNIDTLAVSSVDTTFRKPITYNVSTKRMEYLEGWPSGGGGNTIYSADDSLASSRFVNIGTDKTLSFGKGANKYVHLFNNGNLWVGNSASPSDDNNKIQVTGSASVSGNINVGNGTQINANGGFSLSNWGTGVLATSNSQGSWSSSGTHSYLADFNYYSNNNTRPMVDFHKNDTGINRHLLFTVDNANKMNIEWGRYISNDFGFTPVSAIPFFTNGSTGAGWVFGATAADASAALEVSSTTKGFLLPRMTKTQRDAISSPVAGLMIYQTDNTPGLRVYNGTNWMRFTETAD